MQQENSRRSNRDRTDATRAALIGAARALFVEKSYAETGTPEIVAAAGVTRGALYHHFADKQALFLAVVEAEAEAVAREIDAVPADEKEDAVEALIKGGFAFITAMATAGRTRLLLLDGPAVLGARAMQEVDARHGARTLKLGLREAMASGQIAKLPIEALTSQLSAAFDRAALAVEAGGDADDHRAVLAALIRGLARA